MAARSGLGPTFSGEVADGLLYQFGGGGVGVAGCVKFHGAVTLVACGFQDLEGFCEVDVELLAGVVETARRILQHSVPAGCCCGFAGLE